MREESSQDSRRRVRVATNVYRRATRDGDRFDVAFRDTDGRMRFRVLAARTQRAAEKEARAILAGRDDGDRVIPEAVTVAQFWAAEYLPAQEALAAAGRRSWRGVDMYVDRWRQFIEPAVGDVRLGELEGTHVGSMIAGMRRRGYAEATILQAVNVLRAVVRLARARRLIRRDPFGELDPSERPRPKRGGHGRVLDEPQLATLVRHAPDGYEQMLAVLAYTGLRVGELLGLRWADVDLVDGEIRVTGQLREATRGRPAAIVPPKTLAGRRVVPMLPAVSRSLVDRLESEQAAGRGRDQDLVFCTRFGTPLLARNLRERGVRKAAKAAGLGSVTPHDLRRSFASLAGRRGVDPVEAAQLTGHTLDVWARFYARSFGPEQRREAVARLQSHGLGADASDGGPIAPR